MQQDTTSSLLLRLARNSTDVLCWDPLTAISVRRWTLGVIVALGSFAALGTLAALWENPFFVRMTPAGGWEIAFLALMAGLGGFYTALRRQECRPGTASVGGILGFLGIACPVCNKILLLIFGGEMLLTYFEPIRIYVAAGGSALLATAVWMEFARPSASPRASRSWQRRGNEARVNSIACKTRWVTSVLRAGQCV